MIFNAEERERKNEIVNQVSGRLRVLLESLTIEEWGTVGILAANTVEHHKI